MRPVAGVLLAAGEGRRLGRPKALVRYEDELLVERGAKMLAAAGCLPVVLVLGAGAGEVVATADLTGCEVVVNDTWATGMAGSVRTGLAACDGAAAAVIALVDQPRVTADVVRRLVETWQTGGGDAVAATYAGRQRNPVLLSAGVWDEVCGAAHDDVGARAWLRDNPARVRLVECGDLGDPRDIDTAADLEA